MTAVTSETHLERDIEQSRAIQSLPAATAQLRSPNTATSATLVLLSPPGPALSLHRGGELLPRGREHLARREDQEDADAAQLSGRAQLRGCRLGGKASKRLHMHAEARTVRSYQSA